MALLDAWRVLTGGGKSFGESRARSRGRLRRGRQVTAAVLGLVVTAGLVAGVTAIAVAKAPAARATSGPAVAVVLVNGESSAPESAVLTAAGYSVTQVSTATLAAMSKSTFQGYAAVVIGDSSSSTSCSTTAPSTTSLGTTWEGWVTGNVAVLGTAPAMPGTSGANALIADAAAYAAKQPSSGSVTGLYLSLNCGYSTAVSGTAVSLLSTVEGIGAAGGLTVNGSLACTDTGTVNKWEADSAQTFGGFASASLGTGGTGFPSPSCPVREAFDSWPAMFTPVAYDAASDAKSTFTASDGVAGQPYVLLGDPASAATQALAPTTGGEVPAGTTAGGGSLAAPGAAQATAGDPVNTENGDFTQSATDESVPGFGPSLAFTRTYDADVAQAETESKTPGPMGYGWTDNWATSLTADQPEPGDIYTVDGLETDTGQGGAPTSAAMHSPGAVYYGSSGTYIADTADNRIEEVPSSTGTQWGISMTAGDIYTIAGSDTGAAGDSASGTKNTSFLLDQPSGVSMDNYGDLFIADSGNNRVLEMAAVTSAWGAGASNGDIPSTATVDDIYLVAGTGTAGTGGDSKAAIQSALHDPVGVFVGGNAGGDLYIADAANNRIQMVSQVSQTRWNQSMSPFDVYTIAGSSAGTSGDSGEGGAATSAKFNSPRGISVDSSGNLYIADANNNQVREVARSAGAQWGDGTMAANDIYTLAGSPAGTSGTSGDGGAASSGLLYGPSDITWSGSNLYIADTYNNRIQEIAGTGHTEFGVTMTADDIYTIAGSSTGGYGYSGNGGLATSAELGNPYSIAIDSSGNLYIADTANNEIREVSASTSDISAYAGGAGTFQQDGDKGPAVDAGLDSPDGVATDAQGDIFIADTYGNRVQEIAVSDHTQFGITMTAGDVYTVAGSAAGESGTSGDGDPATQALLYEPYDVAVSAAGDLYIADGQGMRIQEVPASSGNQWGQPMTAGDMYTIAGAAIEDCGNSGQGGPATSALFEVPSAIALDAAGDVIIEDAENNQVYVIPKTSGTHYGISMTADYLYTIGGQTSAAAGSSGDGGPGTAAYLNDPDGLAVDPAGNVYIADAGNNRIQEIAAATGTQHGQSMTAGDIYTIAGSSAGTPGNTGDGGPAASALLHSPGGLSLDANGDLYIIDYANNRIREIAADNGTQWGQQMTGGDIYNIAGSPAGTGGESGDGGPAAAALLTDPAGIATDPAGDIFVTDSGYSRLREITAASTEVTAVNPAPNAITITQDDGSQVTFTPQSGSSCTAPYVTAGGYCVLPADTGAALTYSSGLYKFSPSPGGDTYTYTSSGQLKYQTDAAGDQLAVAYGSPAPGGTVTGNGTCPSTAASCETITAASGRALILGWSGTQETGQVTSVTDPMDRTWTYAYSSGQLTSATDPLGNKTSYTYGQGSTGNPLLANALLTITSPDAQTGYSGPDADPGADTVNVYNAYGQVTHQTDPMGYVTTFNYCVSAADGDCMNTATGTGFITVSDPDGNSTVYDYDQGVLAADSQWTGTALTSELDYGADLTADGTSAAGTGQDTWATDGNGNMTTYAYDATGDTVAVTAPDGIGSQTATTTAWYSQGNQTCAGTAQAATPCSSTEPGPSPVTPGGVISPPSSAPPAGVTYMLYDTDGNELYSTTGIYTPSGTYEYSQTSYQLFKNNSITLNSVNISCTAAPPSSSLPCATINPNGVVTQLSYDSDGDLTQSSAPDGNSGGQLATTTYGYDGDGDQTSQVAPDGNVSGATAATTANYTTATAFNADGQKTSVTEAAGTAATVTPRVTSYGYDGDGNQATVTDARGYTITTEYNADDQATLSADPDGNQTLTCYDGDGNVTETVPPVGVDAGSLTPASCPASYPSGYGDRLATDATTSTFNAAGQRTVMTTPAPAGQTGYETTSYTYDGAGNVLQVSAPAASTGGSAQVTVSAYNAANQLTSQTTGYGTSAASTTTWCYDPNGDTTAVVMPDGNTSGTATCETSSPWTVSATAYPTQAAYQTTSSYDSAGELVSTTSPATAAAPSGATTTATYDAAGNQLTSDDPDGVTTTWTYGTNGQVIGITYSGGTAHAVSYGYDANGQVTYMSDATGASNFVFDPFGELTSASNGAGQTVGYSYDADGDNTGITYPLPASATWATSDTVTYGYDHADTLNSVTDFNGHQIAITNNADSLPDSESLGSSGDAITTSYDATDSPSAITLKNSSSTLQSFSYSDAPDSSILSETDTPSTSSATYTYDGRGRVASMTIGSNPALNYGFDASGNLTALPTGAAATYDHDSELTSSVLSGTTTSYAYNADGDRLTAKQGSTTTASGTWNGADELTAYTSAAAAMSAGSYDGNGLRASATFTPSGGSPATQNYTWNTTTSTPQLLMDSANAYIYAGASTPAEQVSLSAGTITYLNPDALGSVRGIVSSTGALVATTSYDAWGNPQTTGGLTATTPFGYAGAYTDPDGLLYLINRYYDPATGQFTSVDPDVTQTLAPYGYAAGNPVMTSDPDGLMAAWDAVIDGNVVHVSTAAAYHRDVYIAVHYPPPPPPPPAPVRRPKPRPKAHHCGSILSFLGCAVHAIGHEIHKHSKGLIQAGLALGAVALTVANVAQLGADPFTDGAEAADIAGLTDAAADEAAEDAGTDLADAGADGDDIDPGCDDSFSPGTKVLLASGAAIPINQLKAGDKVLATNVKTGKTRAETVKAVIVEHDTDLYDLTVRVGGKTAVIQTTAHHRFWDQTTRRWTYADQLAAGDLLRTPGHAQISVISGNVPAEAIGWMWDLTIAHDHDFYINVAATTAVLVHNCPAAARVSPPAPESCSPPAPLSRSASSNPATRSWPPTPRPARPRPSRSPLSCSTMTPTATT